uniref:Uncharacterized protein n=1 Tax=Lepeophtheirus salmonis TaxID=72036 RepID=A0A0K2TMG1_LEPSM
MPLFTTTMKETGLIRCKTLSNEYFEFFFDTLAPIQY